MHMEIAIGVEIIEKISIDQIMLNVGEHMRPHDGEHLLVQICFMVFFFVLLMFVLDTVRRGRNSRPWLPHIYGKYLLKTGNNLKLRSC